MRRIIYIASIIIILLSCTDYTEFPPGIYTSMSSSSLEETNSSGFINISLGRKLTTDIVLYVEVAGDAEEGVDFIPIANSITIPAGYASVGIPIYTIDNYEFDGDRSLWVTLTPDEASMPLLDFTEDENTVVVDIIDNEVLLEFRSDDSLTKSLVLKRKPNDLVSYEVSRTTDFIGENALVVDGSSYEVEYYLFLEPKTEITTPVELSYEIIFTEDLTYEPVTGTILLNDQSQLELLSFYFEVDEGEFQIYIND